MTNSKASTGLARLKDLLGDVLLRLEALETKAGISAPSVSVVTAASAIPKSPLPSKASLAGTYSREKCFFLCLF